MIRLSWRQFRLQALIAVGLLVAVAVLLAMTGPHLAHLYQVYARAQAACVNVGNCRTLSVEVGELDRLLELLGTTLVGIPALLGAFWGAPLITRELETGTHRLAWTQSVTRGQWLAAKLGVVGISSVAVTGLLSLMVTWWSSPVDGSRMNRFGAGMFGERNVVPLGYAAFGFMLGVAAGVLIRRTLPAMVATLAVFLGVRLAFAYAVRPNLISPRHLSLALDPANMGFGSTNGGPPTLMPNPPNLPNAWVYSTHIVDRAGHGLSSQLVADACPSLGNGLAQGPPPGAAQAVRTQVPAGVQNALENCVTKIGATYHEVVTYQPANRYWALQWYETAIFLGAAVVLVVFCSWWIRRRVS